MDCVPSRWIFLSLIISSNLFASPLLTQPNVFRVAHQHPDTSLQFDPESGLPTATETQVDNILILEPETGLPKNKSGAQLEPPPTTIELGAKESTKIQPVAGGIFNLLKRIGRQPFPLKIIGGLATDGGFNNASNLAISHGFSKGIKIKGYRDLYESFYLYPELTLGVLSVEREDQLPEPKNEYTIYGMMEGHRHWGKENLRAALFLGIGVGGYDVGRDEIREDGGSSGFIHERGVGLVMSAGARISSRTLMGGLHLYRSPGLGEIFTIANVGYQPPNYKTAIVIGAGSLVLFILYSGIVGYFGD